MYDYNSKSFIGQQIFNERFFENDLWANVKMKPPNSREQFLKTGRIQHQNQFAVKVPKITFKDESLQTEFNNFLKKNNFVEKFQELELNTYTKGKKALGIIRVDNELIIRTGDVSNHKIRNNELIYLMVYSNELNNPDTDNIIFKEYSIDSKDKYIKEFRQKATSKDLSPTNNKDGEINNLPFIPWIIYKNNSSGTSDIDLVDPYFFNALDHFWSKLIMDSYFSSPFVFITENTSSNISEDLKKGFWNLNKRVVSINSINSFLTENTPVQFIQNQSQIIAITQAINKYQLEIKKAMFLQHETSDLGTKNLHTTEAQNLNASYENFIETKANLREQYFYDFILLWYKLFTKNYKANSIDVEIIVQGSTLWLEKEAYKVATNQQGISNNPRENTNNIGAVENE